MGHFCLEQQALRHQHMKGVGSIATALPIQSAVALFSFATLYWLLNLVLRFPSRRAEKTFRSSIVIKKTVLDVLYDALVKPFMEPIAQLIPISPQSEIQLQAELKQVGITLTVREYFARAIVLAIYSIPLTLVAPSFKLHPLLVAIFATIPLVVFRHLSTDHVERLKEKRRKISLLLPSFVRSILYSLAEKEEDERGSSSGQVDLVKIFSNYRSVAPEVISYDISLLITEMQSISVEAGLRRFGERIRMPVVTYLCEILIGLSKGQPQANPLAILARDIDVQYREARREELQRRPKEMYYALIPVAVMFIGLLLYIVAMDMINSVGYLG